MLHFASHTGTLVLEVVELKIPLQMRALGIRSMQQAKKVFSRAMLVVLHTFRQ